jgi:pimeloyl-ACP methyl ester carboxylesterase
MTDAGVPSPRESRPARPDPVDHFFFADGLKLHYAEWGTPRGTTLVLAHGNRDHARSWDMFVAALTGSTAPPSHIVSLDLRGHGDSAWSPAGRGYCHEDFLFDLTGLLRHLNVESADIVAHSLGGSMALLFAGCFPNRVRKLVLVEATGPYGRPVEEAPDIMAERLSGDGSDPERRVYRSLEEAAGALNQRFPRLSAEVCAHMARYGTKTETGGFVWKHDPRLRFRSQSVLSEEQIRVFIERIRCPTLLIFGSQSGFLESPRAARVGLFKNAQQAEITGAGHHVPHEMPEELAKIAAPFLAPEERAR